MADPSTCPPLTPASIEGAYQRIKTHIHKTPLITSKQLNAIASHPNPAAFLSTSPPPLFPLENGANGAHGAHGANGANGTNATKPSTPKFNLYFKAESQQRIGAFKARGAFHALTHLIAELTLPVVQSRGVTTHSSGNHAQALALAAHTFNIPSYIVMPTISTPSKIAGTKLYTPNVIFSGSTSTEREAKVAEVIAQTNAILVPPYDHPDIILGQGTAALEMESQLQDIKSDPEARFDAVIAPLGGGGLLSGTATWFSHTSTSSPSHQNKKTLIFGAEPSYSGANDAQIGLSLNPKKRIPHVSSLTIADGLRTPVGLIPWSIISDESKVQSVYSVSEDEIKSALKIMMERTKLFLEPSAVVGLAVVLFCEGFRDWVVERQREEWEEREAKGEIRPWDLGIILSGGNTTVEALAKLFGSSTSSSSTSNGVEGEKKGKKEEEERVTGQIGLDGSKKIEDVAG